MAQCPSQLLVCVLDATAMRLYFSELLLHGEVDHFPLFVDLHLHCIVDAVHYHGEAPETNDDEDAYRKNDVRGRRARIRELFCSTARCKFSDLLLHTPVDRYRIVEVVDYHSPASNKCDPHDPAAPSTQTAL